MSCVPLNRICHSCRYFRDIGVGFCVLYPLRPSTTFFDCALCPFHCPRDDDDDDDPHRQLANVPP